MKILIIQQKMIGDVLTSSILFEALREKYPDAQLDYLINSHTFPVVQENPFINHFVFITPEIENSKLKFYKFLKYIKHQKYDVVIDVYGKISSNLISVFSDAKIRIAYYKKHTSFLYSHTLKRSKKPSSNVSLAIENRLRLLKFLHIDFKTYKPKITLLESEKKTAKLYLQNNGIVFSKPLYMISVLGSNPNKTYPFKYMSKVLDIIIQNKPNAQILFNYIPKQAEDARAILEACKPKTKQQIYFNVFGKNLRDFLAITSFCKAMIGNEGGAINMAKALDIKTFTIFSPGLNKQNWFGHEETNKHIAIHLADYINLEDKDYISAKANPKEAYLKLKPAFFIDELNLFINNLNNEL